MLEQKKVYWLQFAAMAGPPHHSHAGGALPPIQGLAAAGKEAGKVAGERLAAE